MNQCQIILKIIKKYHTKIQSFFLAFFFMMLKSYGIWKLWIPTIAIVNKNDLFYYAKFLLRDSASSKSTAIDEFTFYFHFHINNTIRRPLILVQSTKSNLNVLLMTTDIRHTLSKWQFHKWNSSVTVIQLTNANSIKQNK